METAREIRTELLQMGRDLIAEMRRISGPVNQLVCRLEQESDKYLKDSVDESLTSKRTRKIVYRDTPHTEGTKDEGKPRKRACSKCRQPGHRARNCPN
jgi:hypothetical protein